jgi:hypothetical protein
LSKEGCFCSIGQGTTNHGPTIFRLLEVVITAHLALVTVRGNVPSDLRCLNLNPVMSISCQSFLPDAQANRKRHKLLLTDPTKGIKISVLKIR